MSFEHELASKLRSVTKCFSLTGPALFSSDNEASADELEDEEEEADYGDASDDAKQQPNKTAVELAEEERKKRADELWAELMSSSAPVVPKKNSSQTKCPPNKPDNKANSSTSTPSSASSTTGIEPSSSSSPSSNPSSNSSSKPFSKPFSASSTKIKLTKEYEFAGERIRVEEEVDCSNALASAPANGQSSNNADRSTFKAPASKFVPLKRGPGIGDLVANLGKRQKLSTLGKTKMDWDMFKQDEGIAEDLKNHTKNKNSYVERQAFLQRTDLKQFELEKSIRDKNRTRNAG